jgi:OOP family OmpA-OmpF porin
MTKRARAGGLLIAAALLALPLAGQAQPVNGLYVSGGFGAAILQDQSVRPPAAPGLAPAPVPGEGSATQPGPAGRGSVGYGLGNGLRFEMEGDANASRLRLPQGP